MNSPRAAVLHGKRKRLRRVLPPLVLLALSSSLLAMPLRKTAAASRVVQADVLASEPPRSAPDLLLKKEDERKADALAAFASGIIFEDNGEADKSFAAYQKALGLDPAYADLAVKLALELVQRNDISGAIAMLKDSIKASPKNPETYLYLSLIYRKYLQKMDLAQRYAQQAVDIDPDNFAPYLALYEIFVDTNQQKKAEQVLERASKLDSDDGQFWLQLGGFYVRLLVKDDGSATPAAVKKMNVIFEKARTYAAEDPNILTKVADYYVLTGQVKESIPLYLKVLELKQNTSDATLAAVQDKLAKSFRLMGQRDEAIAMLEKLIKKDPMRYGAYEFLGELYEEKGDPQRALENYQQMLLLDPAQPLNYLRVAEFFMRTKNLDKAVQTMKEAHQKFPRLPQVTYSLAIALTQAKQNAEAIATYDEALHEAQNGPDEMLNGQFYFNYGAAAEQAGLTDKAAELMKKSIELDPTNAAQAYNFLGYMWADKGQHLEEAGDFIKRALDMEPDNPAYLDSLGWWYFKKGDTERALTQLQKAAAAIKPEDPVVDEHLGDAYAKLNNVAQALVYWQKAAALDPENKNALTQKIENAKQKIAAHPASSTVQAEP